MTVALLENPGAEMLTTDELAAVTGYKHAASQRAWLEKNHWAYVTNSSGRPVVGRWYARMRLAGIKPTQSGMEPAWAPDFSAFG